MTEQKVAVLLQDEAKKAEEMLVLLIRQSERFSSFYSYKTRAKADIIEKLTRKRKIETEYDISDITDIVGVRFITLFRVEMVEVYNIITDIIQGNIKTNPSLFLKDSIEEIKYFHTRKYDDILNKVDEITKSKNISITVEPIINEREYSSIHIVARLDWNDPTIRSKIPGYNIPIEIQIRTSYEDSWAEIDHKYKYDVDKKDKLEINKKTYNRLGKHLIALKRFSDSCAEYADAIYYDVNQEYLDSIDDEPVYSVETDRQTVDNFRTMGIDPSIIDIYKYGRKLRLQAEKQVDTKNNFERKKYIEAKEIFKSISNVISIEDLKERSNYLLYYYSKMNEAICLLSTNEKQFVDESLNIYTNLTNNYYKFPLLKMRLGQAHGKLNHIEIALDWLRKSYAEIQRFEKAGNKYSDSLPVVDYRHIKTFLPKFLGYTLWRKSEKIAEDDGSNISVRLELLQEAYKITEEMIIHDLEKDKNLHIDKHNNLLYYAQLIICLSRKSGLEVQIQNIEEELSFHLSRLEDLVDLESTNDLYTLDTILRAYDQNGESEKIPFILGRIIPLAKEKKEFKTCDIEVVDEILKFAEDFNSPIGQTKN